MSQDTRIIVVTDTSVVINFLKIDKAHLLQQLGYDFIITDHVLAEVGPVHQPLLKKVLDDGILRQVEVTDSNCLCIFATLMASGRLGAGECSAIAYAKVNDCVLGIDDKLAKKQALQIDEGIPVLGTKDLLILMIQSGVITVSEADEINNELIANKFDMKVGSFADLVSNLAQTDANVIA